MADKWQVSFGPIRPVAGKFADKARIENIVSFITREMHIFKFLVSSVWLIVLKYKATKSMRFLRREAKPKEKK